MKFLDTTSKQILFFSFLFAIILFSVSYFIFPVFYIFAFTGPSSSAGSGNGAISVDASGNVGIGTASPGQKLSVSGTIESTSGGFKFPDGSTQISASGAASTLSSGNISSGQFGANTGGGNYSFPASVGIGTSTPGTVLDVNGATRSGSFMANANNSLPSGAGPLARVFVNAGYAVFQGYNGTSNTQIPVTFDGSHLLFNIGGAEKMRIDNTGNVGIGTTTPTSILEVAATQPRLKVTSNGTVGGQLAALDLTATVNGVPFTSSIVQGNGSNAYTLDIVTPSNVGSNAFITFSPAGVEKMRIQTNGNVGIGTSTPARLLHVNGDYPQVRIQNPNAGNGEQIELVDGATTKQVIGHINTINGFQFADGSSNVRMTILNTGNVGIGATAPLANLEVRDTGGSGAGFVGVPGRKNQSGLYISGGGYTNNIEQISFGYNGGSGTTYAPAAIGAIDVLQTGQSNNALFFATRNVDTDTAPTIRMYIDPSGNVGIGTTNPQGPLHISNSGGGRIIYNDALTTHYNWMTGNNVNVNNAFEITASTVVGGYTFSTPQVTVLGANGNVGIGTTAPAQKLDVSGTIRQSAATNCNIGANASGDLGCQSDERLKDIRGNYISGLDVIMGMNPIRFSYIGESYAHVGFSAQNVQTVLKEATPLQHDGYLGLDSTAITAAIVNAIKELNDAAVKIKDGVVQIGHLTADLIETSGLKANYVAAPKIITNEFEMKDSVTGDISCVTLKNGELAKANGACQN